MAELKLLLRISMFHHYYDDGIMRKMELVPDDATQRFIDRYHLQKQQVNGEFSLYYFNDGNAAGLIKYLQAVLNDQPLVFRMISKNRNFDIISNLPVNWCGCLYYSSEDAEVDTSQETQPLKMAMQLSQDRYSCSGALGKISIFPTELFDEGGRIRNPYFCIEMKSRSTHWYYYILNRNHLTLTRPAVRNRHGMEFSGPEKVDLSNGEGAMRFTSGKRKFPFRETPEYTFDLINFTETDKANEIRNGRTKARVLVKALPVPTGNRINIRTHNDQECVYSEMYVYI